MIRLRSLKLEGFLSHRLTELEFDDESYVILGENASGKTSILRGIFFALFGKDFSSDKLERIVNKQTNKLSVFLSFLHRGNFYTVKRKFSLVRKKSEAELEKNGKPIAIGVKNVNHVIEKELGLDPNIFRNTVYIPQGEILTLFEIARKEKRQVLNRLLGLEEINRKHEKVKVFINRIKALRDGLLEKRKSFEELEIEIGELRKEVERTKESIARLRTELAQEKVLLDNQEKLCKNYREKRNEYNKLRESLRNLKNLLEGTTEEVKRLNQKIVEIEKQQALIPQLEKELKTLDSLKTIRAILDEISQLRLEEKEIESKLKELENTEKELLELSKKVPKLKETFRETELLLEHKGKELRETEKVFKELKTLEKSFREITIRLSDKQKDLKSLDEKIKELPRIEKAEELSKKKKETLKELENTDKEIATLEAKLEEAEKRIRILESSESLSCPVCGSPMNKVEKEKLLLESKKEIDNGIKVLKQLKEKKEKLKKLMDSLEKKAEKFLQLEERKNQLIKDRERFLEEVKELKNKLNKHSFNYDRLKKTEELFTSLKEQVAALEEKRKNLEKEVKELETKKVNLSKNYDTKLKEELQNRLESLKTKEACFLNEIKKIKEEHNLCVSSAKEVDMKLKELETAKEELNKIQGEARNLSFYYGEKKKKEDLIKSLEKEVLAVQEKIEKLNYSEEEYLTLEETYEKQKKRVESLEKELSRESGKLETLEKQLKVNIKKLKQKESDIKLLERVENAVRVVNAVAEGVHPEKGFLQKVRKSLLPQIALYCKDFFEEFDFEFGDIDISEDLTVTFGIPGRGTMQVEEFSGGQQIAFALSLRFAMARYFSQNFELLILDEPTIHLDQQRRQSLTDLLIKLKNKIPQMIIVTHDPELEVVGDRVIRVKNIDGNSEVSVM
ncbi:AAA family ATPase [Desulfurobacterium thermolithotrophum]|uniref:AAA family ATPase n=1 Tax=Desulfurobacterium thermolithotrophum TaxID=64160 RepID=UPI0013D6D50E|nr:SMC family ATPase [Desulfurobacterium thermolithotrophum]